MDENTAAPARTLSVVDVVSLMIGVVIGIGVFKTPSLVAANTGSETFFLLAWLLGGGISLIGALVGVGVLLTGAFFLLPARPKKNGPLY